MHVSIARHAVGITTLPAYLYRPPCWKLDTVFSRKSNETYVDLLCCLALIYPGKAIRVLRASRSRPNRRSGRGKVR
jgi:hypothetical protein